MEWITFQGKKVSTETIDHQHLSNAYWFALIILNQNSEQLADFVNAMKSRFNGQILPYRPHVDFTYEINKLGDMGLVKMVRNKKYEIVFKGEVVGEIIYPYTFDKERHDYEKDL